MTVKEATELLISVKGKKTGINKDTKDLIKKMITMGDLETENMNTYYLTNTAETILRIKDVNDYFEPKEIGRVFLTEVEKISEDAFDYVNLIKVVLYTDTDPYRGGLNDEKWGDELLAKFFSLEPDGGQIEEIANHISYENKEKAHNLLKRTPDFKFETMWEALCIAENLIEEYEDRETAKKIIHKALSDKLEIDERSADKFNSLKTDLKI